MTEKEIANPPSRVAPSASLARILLWASLGAISALAWLYLVWMPMSASDLGKRAARLLGAAPPGLTEAALMFLMWTVMMVAMMLPSAAPMIETYARIARARGLHTSYRVALFTAGYLTIWTGFSAVATGAQVALQHTGMVSAALTATPLASAILLAAAGLYQVTPLKDVCLTKCRSPLGFLLNEWSDEAVGAFRMGLHHGVMCAGCCSMLMLLLFVFGVMNLMWVAALSVFILLEKLVPQGRLIARLSGYAMLAGAAVLLL